ncbi:hypothetical protein BK816_04700 [Boudabousia tangfeifanii]|uniref:DUF3159 domain-containing protein n=2 Tax=Boudabousia tangfeifanii TaxID=1912795 RepID=A0A1D9MMT7_9ACTO|nr:hypothetical protein BK816_04700 [Boudabousia tangfeifanii]
MPLEDSSNLETNDEVEGILPAGKLGQQVTQEEFSWQSAVGGTRGLLETTLPGVGFIFVYVVAQNLNLALAVALGLVALFLVVRLIQKSPINSVLSGFFGILIGAIWAWKSGDGVHFYTFGLITNAVEALVVGGATLIGYDPVSWGLSYAGLDLPSGWKKVEKYQPLLKACRQASWLLAGMGAIRLAIELPLWWFDYVVALGTAKLILGLPFFALVIWLMWSIVTNSLKRLGLR